MIKTTTEEIGMLTTDGRTISIDDTYTDCEGFLHIKATDEIIQPARKIVDSMIYFGATIQTQANGYHVVLMNGRRQGGLVSIEEAQAYILGSR